MLFILVSSLLLSTHIAFSECAAAGTTRSDVRTFPDGFIFGAATSSYQVEGAWDEDGKGESIWDRDTHQIPSLIMDESTGDIADDSYHQWRRDVEMARELGLDYYRLSLSWSRLLPTGFPDQINQAGVDYYNNLIDELLLYNIQPMVTLYHWDLPQKLQDLGGWASPHSIDWFGDYARIAFELFGDRVKHWITVNEPKQICTDGYGATSYAPRLDSQGIGIYLCAKYLLLSHAKAYHIYDKDFRQTQGGSIFITISAEWYEPEPGSQAEAAEITVAFDSGLYAYPIFSETGDWHPIVKQRVADKSAEQGFPRSRLPEFTEEEIEYLRGSSDYFGLNHYSTYYVTRNETVMSDYAIPSMNDDCGTSRYQLDEWATREEDRTLTVPWGFYTLLMHITNSYGPSPIFVTENGLGTRDPSLEDVSRVTYYRGYISALLDAIDDGADVRAYTAWSLMDNFEWSQGYTARYGLYQVDYSSPQRTRTPRRSAFVYKEIVRSRALDPNYEPDTIYMTIDEGH